MNKTQWISCKHFLPAKDGKYLVTTVNGAVRIDRFSHGEWGACMPHAKNKGVYRPHLAWSYLPRPARFDEKGNLIG